MAPSRSSLASYALADAHVPLTLTHAADTLPAPQEPPSDPPLPRGAGDRLVNFPCRLRPDQIAALNRAKADKGTLPADLIRYGVDLALHQLKKQDEFMEGCLSIPPRI